MSRIKPEAIFKDRIIVTNPLQEFHFKDLCFDIAFNGTFTD